MTHEQYVAQNKLGFEGDTLLKEEFENLVLKHDIKNIIETGSFRGCTTREFSSMVENVYSIEIVNENYIAAQKECAELKNVRLYNGSSEKELQGILKNADTDDNILFFLDAHWQDYNPLLDELKVIAEARIKPVIVIHDFKVPNRPDLGYDSYKGQDYNYQWIESRLHEIYGDSFTVRYNSQATGAKRGVIIIEPK